MFFGCLHTSSQTQSTERVSELERGFYSRDLVFAAMEIEMALFLLVFLFVFVLCFVRLFSVDKSRFLWHSES